MTVLRTAGPRRRLQLVRRPVYETGTADQRYTVRLLSPDGEQVLGAYRRFGQARLKFEEEADWRRWEIHPPAAARRAAA